MRTMLPNTTACISTGHHGLHITEAGIIEYGRHGHDLYIVSVALDWIEARSPQELQAIGIAIFGSAMDVHTRFGALHSLWYIETVVVLVTSQVI